MTITECSFIIVCMRRKDENKKEAIFEATISLLNEIGFYQISMSKIAKRAGVSAATIYVYFEDKDDMIRKLYLDVKNKFCSAVVQNLDVKRSIQQNFEYLMRRTMDYIIENKEYFLFLEQFSNSPLVRNLCVEDKVEAIKIFSMLMERGKKEGILKQVDDILLMNFCYYPVAQIAKTYFEGSIELTEDVVQSVIDMSWDALRA